jgi:hypothetical protein
MPHPVKGKVTLVAGTVCDAGRSIAVKLGTGRATVYGLMDPESSKPDGWRYRTPPAAKRAHGEGVLPSLASR